MTGFGTAAGAKDIRTKSHSTGVVEFEKEWVIVPWTGRRHWVIRGSLVDAPASQHGNPLIEDHRLRISPRLGSSFLNNPVLYSRWFHRPR